MVRTSLCAEMKNLLSEHVYRDSHFSAESRVRRAPVCLGDWGRRLGKEEGVHSKVDAECFCEVVCDIPVIMLFFIKMKCLIFNSECCGWLQQPCVNVHDSLSPRTRSLSPLLPPSLPICRTPFLPPSFSRPAVTS